MKLIRLLRRLPQDVQFVISTAAVVGAIAAVARLTVWIFIG